MLRSDSEPEDVEEEEPEEEEENEGEEEEEEEEPEEEEEETEEEKRKREEEERLKEDAENARKLLLAKPRIDTIRDRLSRITLEIDDLGSQIDTITDNFAGRGSILKSSLTRTRSANTLSRALPPPPAASTLPPRY